MAGTQPSTMHQPVELLGEYFSHTICPVNFTVTPDCEGGESTNLPAVKRNDGKPQRFTQKVQYFCSTNSAPRLDMPATDLAPVAAAGEPSPLLLTIVHNWL